MALRQIEERLELLDFHLAEDIDEYQFPSDLTPDLVTTEGSVFFVLDDGVDIHESLFEAVGKLMTFRKILKKRTKHKIVSISLALTLSQFKSLQQPLKQVLFHDISLLIT